MPGRLPLHDVRVLDLSWIVAGPTVGRVLSDYGATVVHVETSRHVDTTRVVGPFHGGVPGLEHSALYGNINAGKLGMAMDLAVPEAQEVVRELAAWADVVTESFSPGVLLRWGLDYEHLRQRKPGLVMLSTCLMGQTGPYRMLSGFGNIGASMAGFQNLVGWPDRPPAGPFGPYSDYPAPRFSIAAVLAALDHRRRTGEGCYIDQAQAESATHFLAPALLEWFTQARAAERRGNRHPQMAPHGVYPCRPPEGRDEAWVAIAVRSDSEWVSLAEAMRRADLAADASLATLDDRLQAADVLDEAVSAWTSALGAHEVESLLQARGIPAHVASRSEDALTDPQLAHRGHFVELEHPVHTKTVVEASRYRLSSTPASITRAAPTYGRDDDHVLREILGYDDDRIAQIAASGALE